MTEEKNKFSLMQNVLCSQNIEYANMTIATYKPKEI